MKNKQPVPVLIPFLILVSMLFIGILIFAYVETKKANPKMIEVGEAIRGTLPDPAKANREWNGLGSRGSDFDAEPRRKKSPSYARIGRLKPAPPKQSKLRKGQGLLVRARTEGREIEVGRGAVLRAT